MFEAVQPKLLNVCVCEEETSFPLTNFLSRVGTVTMMMWKALPDQMTHNLQVIAYLHLHKIWRASPPTGRATWYLNHIG